MSVFYELCGIQNAGLTALMNCEDRSFFFFLSWKWIDNIKNSLLVDS